MSQNQAAIDLLQCSVILALSTNSVMGHFLQILEEREKQPQKVLEKDPVGSKVLERNVCISSSEIKAEKEQPDHEIGV